MTISPLKRSTLSAIAARDAGVTLPQAVVALDAILAAIETALSTGQEVNLKGFGKFYFRTVPARTVVNTWAGTTQWREAYRRIAFKPALQIAAALRKRDLDDADL